MHRLEKTLRGIAEKSNVISMAAVIAIMTLTVLDVILRFFRYPIPGVYDMVGLLGAVIISFSLAYTSVEKGHIAVDLVIQKLPERSQAIIDVITHFFSILFFLTAAWQCIRYGMDLMRSGEVSMTIRVPIYPFVFGTAVGCLLLTLVLAVEFIRSLQRAGKR
jgi:TRAP-type C4-dicarboxylate transport system permease small subunit